MSILKKLQQARESIKNKTIKKEGRNEYSKYDYFTPEQINKIVHDAEKEVGIIHLFSMPRNEHGLYGQLILKDVETDEYVEFIQATEIPSITATNVAQQVGGAVTYTMRYMLMTAFDIADNTLDFDDKDNRAKDNNPPPQAPIPTGAKVKISDTNFDKLIKSIKETPANAPKWLKNAREKYLFTDDQEKILADWEANLNT